MSNLRRRIKQWPRPWRTAMATLLAVYLLYLVAGNVFLNTPLFDMVHDRQPHKFIMDTGPTITVVPGHVIAWNVRMRGHANHTVYILRAERASAYLDLLALFRREIRIPHLEASGVAAEIERVDEAVEPPPRGDRGWTLRFDAIHSDTIRSARFGPLLITGKGRGTVGFVKQLRGGPSELLDSNVHFENALLSAGGVQLLDDATINSRFHYPRHYRDEAPGIDKLGLLTAQLHIDARSQAIRIDTGGPHVQVASAPSPARLVADLALDKGQLQPGGHAVWRVPLHAGVGATDRGLLALQLDVAHDIRLQARLPRDEETGSELDADLRIAGRDIPFDAPAELLPRVSGDVRGRWKFESLNWIADLFVRKPWFRLDGGGLLEGALHLADGQLAPGSTVSIPHVDAIADAAGIRLRGTASARGRIVDGKTPQARLDVQLPDFRAAPTDAASSLLFEGRNLALTLEGDARLEKLREGVRADLRFKDARVPDLTAYNRYLSDGQVRLLGGTGLLSGDVTLDASGKVGTGSADLRGRGARVQVAGIAMRGDAHLQANARRADFDAKQFDLGGTTLRLQDVRVDGDTKADGRWWGEFAVQQGHIDAAAPYQVNATGAVRLRDAAPILGLYAQRGDYPRWVLGLLDSGEVQATGRLRWTGGQFVVDDLEAENDRLSLRARLDMGQKQRRGDLYVRWGILGAGVELDGDKRQWHLAGARDWYESRPRLLPLAGAKDRSDTAD